MSDRSPVAPLWPLLCGIMALLAIISSAAATSWYLQVKEYRAAEGNMQRRYLVDTKQIAEEMNAAGTKLADESYAKVKAESQIAALQAQIDDLKQQLADAQHKAKPAP